MRSLLHLLLLVLVLCISNQLLTPCILNFSCSGIRLEFDSVPHLLMNHTYSYTDLVQLLLFSQEEGTLTYYILTLLSLIWTLRLLLVLLQLLDISRKIS